MLIIDSGVQQGHPDLNPAAIQACDGSDGFDIFGHGTAVAGVVAAVDNSIGIIGVAPSVELWSSKDGDTLPQADWTMCGVQFGRSNNTFAINISSAFPFPHTPLTDQIKAAYWQNGLIIVAGAGNTGGSVTYPANMEEVIAVAATDANNVRPSWSSTGSALELSAPGVDVFTTCLGSTYCSRSGTSYAAPHVAAAAAILKAHNSSWTNVEIRDRLKNSGLYLGSWNHYGAGLLQVHSAMTGPIPLSATIQGPWEVHPQSYCSWASNVSGGTGPYNYEWRRDGVVVSVDEWYFPHLQSGGNFSLELRVTDAASQLATDSRWVSESTWAPPC